MEDDQHPQQLDGYGGGGGSNSTLDLRHFFSPRPMIPSPYPPPPPAPPPHHSLFSTATGGAFTPLHYPHPQYDTMLVTGGGRGHVPDHVLQAGVVADVFQSDSATTTNSASAAAASPIPAGMGSGGGGFDGDGGGSTARWPRQETLTLLEVRSSLDHKFKEANHKGPLWDQVSRIMCEEHGYQRSGKKCREKFENLYKYYKKTKDGKLGRQDGKNYRFFRQLEALYGERSHNQTVKTPTTNISLYGHNNQESSFPSVSHCSSSFELQTSSSDDEGLKRVKRRGKRSWKSKIKGLIDLQMRKIMETQEAWLEKAMKTFEHKEKERMWRDEEWRSHEIERMEREHKLWVDERSWIEARDRALIDALQKLASQELVVVKEGENKEGDDQDKWEESEITELIRLRASLDVRFEHCGKSNLEEMNLWAEIATRMASVGYDHRSAAVCKNKWEFIHSLLIKRDGNGEKRKDTWRIESVGCSNTNHHQHLQPGESNRLYGYGEIDGRGGLGPPNISLGGGGGGNPMTDSFKFLLGNE